MKSMAEHNKSGGRTLKVESSCEEGIHVNICTHNDLDGYISAAILLRRYPNAYLYFSEPNKLHETLSSLAELCRNVERGNLFILDISAQNQVMSMVLRELKKLKNRFKILWIDHHATWSPSIMKNIGESVDELILNMKARYNAEIVYRIYGGEDKYSLNLLDLLMGRSEDKEWDSYWRRALEGAKIYDKVNRTIYRRHVVQKLALNERSEETDRMYFEGVKIAEETMKYIRDKPHRVVTTRKGRRFVIIDLRKAYMLNYDMLRREVGKKYSAAFLLLIQKGGDLSLQRGIDNNIDFTVLGGKFNGGGHKYSYHINAKTTLKDVLEAILKLKTPKTVFIENFIKTLVNEM
jgi:oligoribonuclease NrnB/cAMP/cGMP phosphodiesterase (DHH superfamily)